jgi:hypothetical protein
VPDDPVEEAADRLYGLPLEQFVTERGAAAKALRQAGEKEAAAQVAKLPKPSQVAWTANQLAREGAQELLDAGEALREAQLGGGGREAVREAAAAEREAVDALLRRAGELRPLSRDASDRLRALLHAVAADEELRERFAAGRLVEEPAGGGAWPLGGFVAPASTAASKERTKAAGSRKTARRGDRDAERKAAERRERERKAAERQEREAARRREEAERRKWERRLKAARESAEAARQRLEAAQEAYDSARHEVARIEEQLD